MKKLGTLLTLFALGLFAVGCTDAGTETVTEPAPPEEPGVESGSGLGVDTVEEGTTEETPPVTDEAPPETATEIPAETPTEAQPETSTEEAAANESATEAAEGSASAQPEGANNP